MWMKWGWQLWQKHQLTYEFPIIILCTRGQLTSSGLTRTRTHATAFPVPLPPRTSSSSPSFSHRDSLWSPTSNLWSSCLSLPRVTSRVGYPVLIQCDSAKRFFFRGWLLRHTWCVLAVPCWPGRSGFRITLLLISTWEQAACPVTHLPSIWRFIYKVGIWHFFPFLSQRLDYICRILTFSSRSSVLTA